MANNAFGLYTAETFPEDKRQTLLDALDRIGVPVNDLTWERCFEVARNMVLSGQHKVALPDFWKSPKVEG